MSEVDNAISPKAIDEGPQRRFEEQDFSTPIPNRWLWWLAQRSNSPTWRAFGLCALMHQLPPEGRGVRRDWRDIRTLIYAWIRAGDVPTSVVRTFVLTAPNEQERIQMRSKLAELLPEREDGEPDELQPLAA